MDKKIPPKKRHLLVFRNSLYSIFDQVSGLFLALIIIAILARNFGPADVGKYTLAVALTSLVSVVTNFGFQALVKREVAKDRRSTGKFLGQATLLRFCLSLPSSVAAVFFLSWVLGYGTDMLVFTQIVNLFVFLSGIFALNSSVLISLHRSKDVLLFNLLYRAAVIIFLVFVAALDLSLQWYAVLLVFATVIPSFFSSKKIRQVTQRLELSLDVDVAKKLLVDSAPLMLAAAAEFANLKLDSLIVGHYHGNDDVGFYSVAFNVLMAAVILPLAITKVLFPNFIQIFRDEGNERAFYFLRNYLYAFSLYGIITTVFLIIFSEIIVSLIFGAEFGRSSAVLSLLAFGVPFIVFNRLFNYLLVAMHRDSLFFSINFFCLLLNLSLNFALIPQYSLFGAAIATIITEFAMMFASGVAVYRRMNFLSTRKSHDVES